MSKEGGPQPGGEQGEPIGPELPAELAYFLKDTDFACLTHATTEGTAFVIKAPRVDIGGMGAHIPIRLQYELYQHPQAPVIRTAIRIFDRPDNPLALETFINVAEEDQREDFARLSHQDELLFLFYDEDLAYRRGIRVKHEAPDAIEPILAEADRLRAGIPEQDFDFDRAKADVMRRVSM